MNTIGERIKWARAERGQTQAELAKAAGVSTSTIGNLESGLRDKPRDLLAIASALRAAPSWLESGRGEWQAFDANATPIDGGKRAFPVISTVQAGLPRDVSDPYMPGDGFDIEYGDASLGSGAFFLQIDGDSMLPEFRAGDRIAVDPNASPRPGDFVVAKNDGEEATFKKYRARGTSPAGEEIFELVPLNPDYATLRSDLHPLVIIGVMVEHRRRYRR